MPREVDADVSSAQGRIERLLDELRDHAPADTLAQVEELVEHVVTLYGTALARVAGLLGEDATSMDDVRTRLVEDPLLSTLLVVHGLHPLDLRERVERALAEVTPYVASHGGQVLLVGIQDDVVSLKLKGACESCSSSAATATELLERAVRDAAPEIARVEVDTGTAKKTHAGGGLVQLGRTKSAAAAPPSTAPAHEACEMCGSAIDASHDHVARVGSRDLLCVCRACRLLFAHDGATSGKYRPISDRFQGGDAYALTELEWARLGIPVRMAFFVVDSQRRTPVGFYPSPGGVVEAAVDADAWTGIPRAPAVFAELAPDVEAWLVDGRGRDHFEGWLVPLDACYELVAYVRLHWAGFDGGEVARAHVDAFFDSVRARSPAPDRPDGPDSPDSPGGASAAATTTATATTTAATGGP